MANKSNPEQPMANGLLANHVFTENGIVFIRSAQQVEQDEWSAINFYWMPVLQLEQELGS